MTSNKNLPSYKKPPVNEVVCGVVFNTPDKLTIPHIGLLWQKFSKEYPNVQHAQPIIFPNGMNEDKNTGLPLPRIWFINEKDDQLVQIQFNRFYYNWRRRKNAYPRYHCVIGEFEDKFNMLLSFFEENNFGDLLPNELELSYINHIPNGEGWNEFDDLKNVFTDFTWNKTERFLPTPERINWSAHFIMPDQKGSLTATVKEAMRTTDKVKLLVFELAARWKPDQAISASEMRQWFDLAHQWIVEGFTDLTTAKIQKEVWEREYV